MRHVRKAASRQKQVRGETEVWVGLAQSTDTDLSVPGIRQGLTGTATHTTRKKAVGRVAVSIRLPRALLRDLKGIARRRGTKYQTLVSRVLEDSVRQMS